MTLVGLISVGKPLVVTGFGLVTQDNFPFFVPFNSSVPVQSVASDNSSTTVASGLATATNGVTDDQRDQAYTQWLNGKSPGEILCGRCLQVSLLAGINAGLSGLMQYQWSAPNLTASPDTIVQGPINNGTSAGTLGQSPDDGYGSLG